MNLGRENEQLEFKKTTGELKDAVDDICAMLNKHGSGRVIFGVWPNGEAKGQEIGNLTLDDIASVCKEAISPMIYPSIKEVDYGGAPCIQVDFAGRERPYSSYGIYYKRVVDRSERMTSDEIKSVMASTDYTSKWENCLTSFGVDCVDKAALRAFYDASLACGRLDPLPVYDEEKLLIGLGLMEDGRLTNAGLYLFSNKKPVVLKIATYVTDERINFSDIRRVEDNIFNLIRYANGYVKDHMNWRVESGPGTSRLEIPEVPVEALREIIVNSFAHANYRGVTENEIDITPTEIEIYNPGEFPINLDPKMFVDSERKSQPRNRVILNTLFKCKDVEMFGSGFRKVFASCKTNGVKFSYVSNDDGFSFIFYRRQAVAKDVAAQLSDVVLSTGDHRVLNCLKENPNQTREEIASSVKLSKSTVARALEKLSEAGKISRIGSKKKGYWEIL